jgi:hypothetical protein
VWPVGGAEAEAGGEVVDEVSLLLNVGQESLVDGLLVLDAVLGGLLLLWYLLVLFAVMPCRLRTSGFSPCLKKASSPGLCAALSLVK